MGDIHFPFSGEYLGLELPGYRARGMFSFIRNFQTFFVTGHFTPQCMSIPHVAICCLAPLKRWFGTEGSHTSQQESPGVPYLDYGGVMLAKQMAAGRPQASLEHVLQSCTCGGVAWCRVRRRHEPSSRGKMGGSWVVLGPAPLQAQLSFQRQQLQ